LHLLQALGYPFHDGVEDSVERREIVVRFYPGSNSAPGLEPLFFHSQAELDAAAERMGLSKEFANEKY
jgi:hypothetical protein